MANYTWQLGIDWSAVEIAGVSYLRGGLLQEGVASPGTNPVQIGDIITFQIFDVSSSVEARQVDEIAAFCVLSKAAVKDQQAPSSLSNLRPAMVSSDASPEQPSLFGPAYCSWTSDPVEVGTALGRFLLTTQVKAVGKDRVTRLFSHDPEMVVGPNT
jgi:hypothetical protein